MLIFTFTKNIIFLNIQVQAKMYDQSTFMFSINISNIKINEIKTVTLVSI